MTDVFNAVRHDYAVELSIRLTRAYANQADQCNNVLHEFKLPDRYSPASVYICNAISTFSYTWCIDGKD